MRQAFDRIALAVVLVGALDWGLIGLLDVSLIGATTSTVPVAQRLAHVLIGAAGAYLLASKTRTRDDRDDRGVPQ